MVDFAEMARKGIIEATLTKIRNQSTVIVLVNTRSLYEGLVGTE